MNNVYTALKQAHAGLGYTTFFLFSLRLFWVWQNSNCLQRRWVRIVPHIVDTLLLVLALTLIWLGDWYLGMPRWLYVKLGLIVGYIMLGFVAFRLGKTRVQKLSAGSLAVCMLVCIVYIAKTKSI